MALNRKADGWIGDMFGATVEARSLRSFALVLYPGNRVSAAMTVINHCRPPMKRSAPATVKLSGLVLKGHSSRDLSHTIIIYIIF